jgi:hypothetical protein
MLLSNMADEQYRALVSPLVDDLTGSQYNNPGFAATSTPDSVRAL